MNSTFESRLRAEQRDLTTLPRKAQRITLAKRVSVRDVARAGILDAHAQFLHNATGARRTFDAELLHQTRVGVRRLRVYLRLFRSRVGRRRAKRLGAELRWLFAPLGRLRDLQVFTATFLPQGNAPGVFSQAEASASTRSARVLRARVGRRVTTARRELGEAFDAPRFEALCQELCSLTAELEEPKHDRKRARPWLTRRLKRLRKRVLSQAEAPKMRDLPALHALRKDLKKLRYVAELARGLYRGRDRRVRPFFAGIAELQDALGALLDIEVGRTLLTEVEARSPARARDGTFDPSLAECLAQKLAQESVSHLAQIDDRFQRFAEVAPFWTKRP